MATLIDPTTGQSSYAPGEGPLLSNAGSQYSPQGRWNAAASSFYLPPAPLPAPSAPENPVSGLLFGGKPQGQGTTVGSSLSAPPPSASGSWSSPAAPAPQTEQKPSYLSTEQGMWTASRGLDRVAAGASAQGGPQFSAIGSGIGQAAGSVGGPAGAVAGGATGAAIGGLIDWWISARDAEKAEKAAKRQEAETRRWQEIYMTRERKLNSQADQRFANEMSAVDLEKVATKRAMAEKYRNSINSVLRSRINRAGMGVSDQVEASPLADNSRMIGNLQGAF